ncbi:hypothetical protein, partial [Staphylococcus aureus]|uniref:hypothetical protein n=1 Tax=Staphylococcus aureus TaxID=1280 RepID=UPI00301BC078
YQDSTEPFVRTVDGIDYVGDANTREQRIDASRLMKVTENGEAIFRSVASGAGYVAEADPGNAGSVTFSGPRVIDNEDADYGEAFRVVFTGDTQYDVERKNAGGGWDTLT